MPKVSKIDVIAVLSILIGGGLYFIIPNRERGPDIIQAYHKSQFFNYAPFIESSVEKTKSDAKVDLDKVIGGIVPHHIPTTIPLLAEFYTKLKNTRQVKTFIILGPDHVDRGRGDITVSKADFVMPFGTLKPNLDVIERLEKSGFVAHDETPFDREHSIDSQLLLISELFPEARIVPLIFRSSITNETAKAFGQVLAAAADDETFIVSSVDFSHYLSEKQARPIDYLSLNVLGAMNSESTALLEADSTQALAAFMAFLEAKGANHHIDLRVFNTGDFSSNSDYTTGYVTGFWGIKRNPSGALNSSANEITLLFAGDVMLSRAIGDIMQKKNDWRYPFLKISDVLKSADLVFGNLEGPISRRGARLGSEYSFRADPRAIEGLWYAGFDIVSVANNHIWDYGREAYEDTLDILRSVNINYVGGGMDYGEAHQPLIKEIKGTKIAFLGYSDLVPLGITLKESRPAVAFLDINQVISDITKVKGLADFVAVSFHWGNEYETKHTKSQEKIARAAIDAGANLVIGHHPHVVQEVEEYSGGYIAYSLGNFVFDQNFSEDTRSGLLLKVILRNKKIAELKQQRVKFTPSFQPFLDGSNREELRLQNSCRAGHKPSEKGCIAIGPQEW